MAKRLDRTKLRLSAATDLFLPLVLWLSLWLSLQSGEIGDIFRAETPVEFLKSLRVVFPYVTALLAVQMMLRNYSQRETGNLFFSSPLALTTVYGLVGIFAALLSPDFTTALQWNALYLIVPLVVWAAIWGDNPLERIGRIIQLNGLIILLGVAALFIIGLAQMDLGDSFLNPSALLRCESYGNWFVVTSGYIRSTGVGRFAAVAAIIALGMSLRGNLWLLWVVILLASLGLLLSTGARTSIIGLSAAAPTVLLLHFGRKAIIGGSLALIILVPLIWASGAHETFLENCILIGTDVSAISYLNMRSPTSVPTVEKPTVEKTYPLPKNADDTGLTIPTGFYTGSGRTLIWEAGWRFIIRSPILGYGFQADRLVLGTHMHNAVLHALIQTGFIGLIPFLAALIFGWVLLIKIVRNLDRFAGIHKTLAIQAVALFIFFSLRGLTESTGAFFGIDWLLLSPLLLYLRVVNSATESRVEQL